MKPSQPLPWLGRTLRLAETFSRAAVWAGGALTLAAVFLIAYDILVRKFFNITVGGADEISSYVFAISTSWALAFVVLQRANVRVDVIYERLPVRVSAFLDWLSLVALGVFMVFLTWHAYSVAETSFVRNAAANTPLATPLWIPQGLWVLGMVWMCVVLALMLTRASVAMVTGDLATVKALCGVVSAKEEAEEGALEGERIIQGERS
ncbi:TRAP transporter small permease subunit [Hydrogenophaga sp.]|uniref:TRAP transporter small permease subunit n=1 Tax=Hydrogenophaga sp. TaxID=1904254 RepID=UPI002FC9D56D